MNDKITRITAVKYSKNSEDNRYKLFMNLVNKEEFEKFLTNEAIDVDITDKIICDFVIDSHKNFVKKLKKTLKTLDGINASVKIKQDIINIFLSENALLETDISINNNKRYI